MAPFTMEQIAQCCLPGQCAFNLWLKAFTSVSRKIFQYFSEHNLFQQKRAKGAWLHNARAMGCDAAVPVPLSASSAPAHNPRVVVVTQTNWQPAGYGRAQKKQIVARGLREQTPLLVRCEAMLPPPSFVEKGCVRWNTGIFLEIRLWKP